MTHFSHSFFTCIYLEAMGCLISTSAFHTKRGSQTWSLWLHQIRFITSDLSHSFNSVWRRTTRNPVHRAASCQSVGTTCLAARPPKHFMSYTTRQGEVNAVIRKFSLRSENIRMPPNYQELLWNNNSNWHREEALKICCCTVGQWAKIWLSAQGSS